MKGAERFTPAPPSFARRAGVAYVGAPGAPRLHATRQPVEGRADKFSGAFNDPANAPDVAEFGNTDVSSYAATGALADLTGDLASWSEGKNLIPTVLDTAKSGEGNVPSLVTLTESTLVLSGVVQVGSLVWSSSSPQL